MTEPPARPASEARVPMQQSEHALHESLSAAIDGEAEDLELRRALNAAQKDPELRAKWRRAHLIGGAIRGEAPLGKGELAWHLHDDALLSDVPAAATPAPRRAARWLPAAVGGAGLAAAVAFGVVALFGDGFGLGAQEDAPPALAERPAPPKALARLPSELDLRRADAYLLRHAQHTAVASPPAAMPFAKVLAAQDGRAVAVPAAMRYEREPSRR